MLGMNISIPSFDGFQIAATIFEADSNTTGPVVVVASATGVPRSFYRNFAGYVAGFAKKVITFDYRGIVEGSLEHKIAVAKTMPQCLISREWAEDTNHVLKYAKEEGRELVYIAHSVGGHVLGFLRDANLITRILFICVNSAYCGWLASGFFVGSIFPWYTHASATFLGYFNAKSVGLGDALPSGIGNQWSHWSKFPNYMRHNRKTAATFDSFPSNIPIEAICYSCDELATQPAFEWCAFEMLPTIQSRLLTIGIEKIGHFGFFREKYKQWYLVENWIKNGKRIEKNLIKAASDGNLIEVRRLVKDSNVKDEVGYSPLHAAASYSQIEVLEFLLSVGADPNIQDCEGDTPLHFVEELPCAEALIKRGAVPTLRNEAGLLPIETAWKEKRTNIVEFLRLFTPDFVQYQDEDEAQEEEIRKMLMDVILNQDSEMAESIIQKLEE